MISGRLYSTKSSNKKLYGEWTTQDELQFTALTGEQTFPFTSFPNSI